MMKPQKSKKIKRAEKKVKHLMFGLFSYWSLPGFVLGAGGGIAYYFYYGAFRQGCIFNSNPFVTALWGALLGFMIFELFRIITIED